MRILVSLFVVALCAPALTNAQSISRGPFLQKLGPHTITVVFELDLAAEGVVRFGLTDELDQRVESASATHHEITLNGLNPSTLYSYQVGAGSAQSARASFATTPERDEPFRFVVYGDTRSDGDDHGHHQQVADALAAEAADFVINTGDLVENGTMDDKWDQFFQIEAELLRNSPIYPVFGNHEQWDLNSEKYRALFSLPPLEDGSEQTWYSFGYGNSRFVVLNTHDCLLGTEMSPAQLAWAEQTIGRFAADEGVAHLFVILHHGPYSSSKHGGASNVRDWLENLPQKDRITLVFSGHDHNYERWVSPSGLSGFVCGGGGAPLYSQDLSDQPYTRYFHKGAHYLSVQVAGDYVQVCPRAPDGSALEQCLEVGQSPVACQSAADCPDRAGDSCSGQWECSQQMCIWFCDQKKSSSGGGCASLAPLGLSPPLVFGLFLVLLWARRRT